ncbi:glucose/quinate/shikimate family membrane-bound PQQ-dependent dehydrogenase [Falsirhodobacter sp. 20TX0035]|uniref:glucose/quinate/shikimate family membrane-bound PQQ-dependent dehydrogenase n=1 Tax=Falsirhodobacter sp. 20TX0035 TaxID=3022019 RepID=UPI00232AC7BB|nr:glucose/quinate/shikimate family membrane-bound PQQ-dependent dehydrogenase [Falsirhodobacter sp. 20TX0035]MDB6454546.1 glucose/quinate/shikimate family membrane-bound PQQ-dependent dehydrogenase [Falsirhodobacter sp. 20TX0035]
MRVLTGAIFGLIGAALAVMGGWLALEGGSVAYLVLGVAVLVTALFIFRGRAAALTLFAVTILLWLAWSVWEVGFDWWQLMPRGGLVVLMGIWLWLPFVRRTLGRVEPSTRGAGTRRAPLGLVLGAAVIVAVAVAVLSMFRDPTNIDGALPTERLAGEVNTGNPMADTDWHQYGRTNFGQRWSPLDQVTTDNVGDLTEVWRYQTGDVKRPDDVNETTYQVTPLKVGDRLFICTPHNLAIALDAVTGKEVWRFDANSGMNPDRQHQTCRGVTYWDMADMPETQAAAPAPANAPPAAPAAPPSPEGSELAAPAAPGTEAPAAPVASDVTPPEDGPSSSEIEQDEPAPPVEGLTEDPTPNEAVATATEVCPTRVYLPTADARLIALNAETGEVCSTFGDNGTLRLEAGMPYNPAGYYYSTSPPVAVNGMLIIGGAVNDNFSVYSQSGVIRAFDIATGELLWNWDSGNPEETTPIDIAGGETYTANSPNSWSIFSVDADRGLVYIPLGNQVPDQLGMGRSEAVEAHSSSIVALDIATGQQRWAFQTVHHDLWDMDVPAQPVLVDLTVGGAQVPALVGPTKQGDIYVLNRETGEPILGVTEEPAPGGAIPEDFTAPTQPTSALTFKPEPLREADMWGMSIFDQLMCRIDFHRLKYEGRYTPPSLEGSIIYPGNFGTFNWGSIAVDPERQVMFGMPTYLAFTSRLVPRADIPPAEEGATASEQGLNRNEGAPYGVVMGPFLGAFGIPCQAPPWGYVAGANLTTGEIAWKHKNGTVRDMTPLPLPIELGVPGIGGPIITRGGVAFLAAAVDDYLRAYDLTTGEELWKARLPAGGQSTPMTYDVGGKQYVVIVAGGHGSIGTKPGDYVIAYALNE